jgi:hypothetical protein
MMFIPFGHTEIRRGDITTTITSCLDGRQSGDLTRGAMVSIVDKSRLHSLRPKKAKQKRKLVITPGYVNNAREMR